MKKFVSVLLSLILVLGVAPLSGIADLDFGGLFALKAEALAETGQCGDNVFWTYDSSTETVTISGSGEMWDWDIEESLFYYSPVKTLKIENGVTSIGSCLFEDCSSLESVTISDSVTYIGYYSFYGCSSLESVTIPDSVTSIGSWAFEKITLILCNKGSYAQTYAESNNASYALIDGTDEENTLSGRVGKLSWTIDRLTGTLTINCTGDMPNVWDVDTSWLNYKYYVRHVEFEGETTSISERAFSGCGALENIEIPDSVANIGYSAFSGCSSLTSLVIPDSVTSIGRSAFRSCSSLTSVTFGNGVTNIEESAFSYCANLNRVNINSLETWCNLNFNFYYYGDDDVGISNPLYYAHNLYLNGELVTDLVIPNGVTRIGEYAFQNCTSLTSVTIPDSVTSIEDGAFYDCSGLTSVELNYNIDYIGRFAFNNAALESAYIYNRDCSIDSNAFYSNTVIYGFSGSTSETYADNNGMLFEALDDIHEHTPVTLPAKEATCSETGLTEGSICSLCGEVYVAQETIAKLPHTEEVIPAVAPTCAEAGLTEGVKCSVCGEILTEQETVAKLPHTDEDGDEICDVCGNPTIDVVDSGMCISNSNISWTYYDNGTLEFSGSGALRCGYYYDESEIYEAWWQYRSDVRNIIINEGITALDQWYHYDDYIGTFQNFSKLESITIPNSVTSITEPYYRWGEEVCAIPRSTRILCYKDSYAHSFADSNGYIRALIDGTDEENTLSGRIGKLSWTIDCRTGTLTINCNGGMPNVADAENSWRDYNRYIKNIEFVGGITSISNSAFDGCSALASIAIPEGVTSIGNSAFNNCSSLTKVNINSLASWCNISFNGYRSNPLEYAHNLYLNDELVEELIIPDSVTSIEAYAFSGCSSLISVTIPDSVTSISDTAFFGCESLNRVNINSIEAWCSLNFNYDPWWEGDYFSNPLYYAHNLYLNDELVTDLVIPDGVIRIGNYAFQNCTSLTSVTIPDSVTSIGNGAFFGCSSLTSVELKYKIDYIGPNTFNNSALESVYIYNRNCSIDSNAFHSNAVIYGFSGSTAETYADSKGMFFEPLDDIHECTPVTVPAKEATCSETGLTEGSVCSLCGEVFVAQETIEKLPHTFDDGEITREPTCSVPGVRTFTCEVCGATETESIDMIPHTMDDGVVTREPTCTVPGVRTFTCEICGATETEWIETIPHTFEESFVMPATCGSYGYRISKCSCGAEQNEAIEPLGHKDENGDGLCDSCGVSLGGAAAHEHTASDWIVKSEATCADNGLKYKECTECGAIIEVELIERLPHTVSGWIVDADPTCTVCGSRHTKCTVCGVYVDIEEIPAPGHAPALVGAVRPTTTTDGYTGDTVCVVCGETLETGSVIPAEGEDPGDDGGDNGGQSLSLWQRIVDWFRSLINKIKALFGIK